MTPETRVLLINDYGPDSPRAGGAEIVLRTTQEGLGIRGIETSLFTISDVPGHRRTALSYLHNAKACDALDVRLKTFSPTVVHLHNYYHELSPAILRTLASWKADRPDRRVVMTAHDFHVVCPNSALTYFRAGAPILTTATECRRLGHLLFNRWDRRGAAVGGLKVLQHLLSYRVRGLRSVVDLYLCPSAFMAAELAAAGLPTRVHSNIAPTPRQAGKTPGDALHLAFAGRLEPEKGLHQFLTNVPTDSAWTLDVIGEGGQAEECKRIARDRRLDDRIRWLGRLPHDQTMNRIGASDVLLLPSVWPENQPLVMLEALAMQTSLLVPDLGGMREIVRETGVGEVFVSGQRDSLVAAISSLVTAKRAGTLNTFDVRAYLKARDDSHYFDGLLRAYGERA